MDRDNLAETLDFIDLIWARLSSETRVRFKDQRNKSRETIISLYRALPHEPRTCETCVIDGAPFTWEKSIGNYCSEIYDKDGIEYAAFEPGEIGDRKAEFICSMLNQAAPCAPQSADVEMVREAHGIEIRNIRGSARHPGGIYGSLYIDGELNLSATLSMCVERAGVAALDRIVGKEE